VIARTLIKIYGFLKTIENSRKALVRLMGRKPKKSYWIIAGTALVLMLLIGLNVILPRVIDSAWLKETIQTQVAEQVNGDLHFKKAHLSLLPRPAVSLEQVSLNIPETAQFDLEAIKVYPRLLSLLAGKIVFSEAVLESPDFSVSLPTGNESKKVRAGDFSFSGTLHSTSAKLETILSVFPGLKVYVNNGTLHLAKKNQQGFFFESINGSFNITAQSLTAYVSCQSSLFDSMELEATVAPGSQEGKGKITLANVNGKELVDSFLAEKAPLVEKSRINLKANFTVSPEKGLTADIQTSDSFFTAVDKDKKVTAKLDSSRAEIHYNDQTATIEISDLTLSSPQARLNGSFNFDRSRPYSGLDITMLHADIKSMNDVVPFFIHTFYGDMPVVDEIFKITRGGTITRADYHVAGKSIADLAVFESMQIKGQMKDGNILLSDPALDLNGVAGDIIIAGGIFEGKNLQATLGNTTGSAGNLTLGLVKKETTPFQLDLKLNADLAEIPPLIKKLLPDEKIQYHLSNFENIQGTASGRLAIGDSLESPNLRVEIDTINGAANFKPVPYPISMNSGRILVDGLKIQPQELQGTIGNSSFSNFTGVMNWEGEPTVDVQSGTFQFVMDEIFPWMTSDQKLADDLSGIQKISGIAEITVKSLKGPLLQPAKLQYELSGDLKNITISSARLPGSVKIKTGQAQVKPDTIIFEELQAEMLDSSTTFSAVFQSFITGNTSATAIVTDATLGDEVNTWLVQEIMVPEEYQFRTPLRVSRSNIKWSRDDFLELEGDFSIENGPIFSLDLRWTPEEFILNNLSVQNGHDRATMELALKKRAIGAGFQGSLAKNTIDAILLNNEIFPEAWIQGEISFHIDMDSPAASSAKGNLEGGSFIFPWQLDKPLLLKSFSFSAADRAITLNGAEAALESRGYSVTGQASLSEHLLSMDFDVATDTIELDKILGALKDDPGEESREKRKIGNTWDLALVATFNIQADSLLFNDYTWQPLQSQIKLDNSNLDISIVKTALCGISTPGRISFAKGQIALDFKLEAENQELSETLVCLEGGDQQMSGTLDLRANISGQGKRDTLVNSLAGSLEFSANEGYIYHDAQMAKLLYALNITNLFKGEIPDLKTAGFNYDSLLVKGIMDKGVLTIHPARMNAPIMEIAANGTIDLPSRKVDLLVLVAPLQTLNTIQKVLPIIGTIIPSSLAAVPVEVKGDFSDVKFRAMSMSAIGKRSFGILVDALATPVRVLGEKSGGTQ
jgi:uncharacterized protein involved in outer membrane biogenesis